MIVLSVVGARPQFIKAAVVSHVLRQKHREILLHTGQHYDHEMSRIFFEELGIPEADIHLGVGSGTHGEQTGAMLAQIERVLLRERPDWVLVYGDTNSTLAGALAAAKLHLPVAHVEAGLRSYNRQMPEEINRVLTDHVSDLLFCPTQAAVDNLAREGITAGVHHVGDVMYDAVRNHAQRAAARSRILEELGLAPGSYFLATVHRAGNTDDPTRLTAILDALSALGWPVVLPAHPRTRKALDALHYQPGDQVRLIKPVGYLDMLQLEQHARAILTDSGGVQKEAYFAGVPCITLREETEWVETVESGWNTLVGADRECILAAVQHLRLPEERPPLYGDGHAAEKIVRLLG